MLCDERNEMRPRTEPESEGPHNQHDEDSEFEPGGVAKESCARSRIEHIDGAENRDSSYGGNLGRKRTPSEDVGSVTGASDGECGGDAGIHDEETHPPIEEGNTLAESFTKVDIEASGLRIAGSEFAEAKCTGERNGSHGEPDDEQPER